MAVFQTQLPSTSEEVSARIQAAVDKTKESLGEVQKQLNAYDEKYQASASVKAANEKASVYLKKGMDEVKTALEDLTAKTHILKDQTAEIPVIALSKAIAAVQQGLDQVKILAKSYDEKYQIREKVLDAVNPAREQCMKYLAEISEYSSSAAAVANAQLQGVNDGLRSKLKEISTESYSFLINASADLDRKFDITNKISQTAKQLDEKYHLAAKAKEIDEKYNIQAKTGEIIEKAKEKGRELDQKYTQGKYTPMVQNAYNDGLRMVTERLEGIKTDFEETKQAKAGFAHDQADPLLDEVLHH